MWTVRWVRSTLDELLEIWIDAGSTERNRITQWAHEIDRLLTADPTHQGESREENR